MSQRARRWRYALALAGLLALTATVYQGALGYDFLYWDDRGFLHDNPRVQGLSLANLAWMLTDYRSAQWHYNWQPLTWLSHAIAYEIWGLDARAFHAINIALHGLNTVAVFVVGVLLVGAARAPGGGPVAGWRWDTDAFLPAFVAAALFALHPQHVESVAWIAERKDVLYALFFVLSVICYLGVEDPVRGRRLFGLSLLAFFLSALAKPMAVTLPGVLLLLDVYPLRRLAGAPALLPRCLALVREKWSFFAISAALAVISLIAQDYGGGLPSLEAIDLQTRLLNACHSIVFYLQTLLVPVGLTPYYPFPEFVLTREWRAFVAPAVVLAVTVAAAVAWRRGRRAWLTVWLYYLGTLTPVIGIVQAGGQAAADRYTYLSTYGVLLLVGAGVAALWHRLSGPWRGCGLAVGVSLAVALAFAARAQTTVWASDERLWRVVLARFPDQVPIAHQNLGNVYLMRGDAERAVAEYRKGLALNPGALKLRSALGFAYERSGRTEHALAEYERIAKAAPESVWVNVTVGDAMLRLGRPELARRHFEAALLASPGTPPILIRLGEVALRAGRFADAEARARGALAAAPDDVRANLLLAAAHHAQGRSALASDGYRRVLALDPDNHDARENLRRLQSGKVR